MVNFLSRSRKTQKDSGLYSAPSTDSRSTVSLSVFPYIGASIFATQASTPVPPYSFFMCLPLFATLWKTSMTDPMATDGSCKLQERRPTDNAKKSLRTNAQTPQSLRCPQCKKGTPAGAEAAASPLTITFPSSGPGSPELRGKPSKRRHADSRGAKQIEQLHHAPPPGPAPAAAGHADEAPRGGRSRRSSAPNGALAGVLRHARPHGGRFHPHRIPVHAP